MNMGIQVMSGDIMWDTLHKVKNENPKHEYYLTGVIKVLHDDGWKQHAVITADSPEYWGVNTMEELEKVEKYMEEHGA